MSCILVRRTTNNHIGRTESFPLPLLLLKHDLPTDGNFFVDMGFAASGNAQPLRPRLSLLCSPWHRLDDPDEPARRPLSRAIISSSSRLACSTSAMDMRPSRCVSDNDDDALTGGAPSSLISTMPLASSDLPGQSFGASCWSPPLPLTTF
uniref:Uncharacterized protein n=1 Tax=Arundo donax TaxID=35708 RepID=A0A0A9GB50_ARUDO